MYEETRELPGSWIDHPDRNMAFMVKMLLDEVLNQLNDARIVVPLFKEKCGLDTQFTEVDHRLQLIYAKSFVYALDAACKIVKVLLKKEYKEHLPAMASDHCERFLSQFGLILELRNSLHHMEDRLRGYGRDEKIIPSNLLVFGSLRNNKYFGITTADGQHVEIEISDSVLIPAYSIIEDLIWCFDWLGPGCIRLERLNHDD